jgi:hypothetical protein
MAITPRWGIGYPSQDDPPEGWLQLEAMAGYLDDALGRALPVVDAAARTALGATLTTDDRGLIVLEDLTDTWWGWTGVAWVQLAGAGGGGGGGGTSSRGRWAASSAQDIASGGSVVAAFGSDIEASPDWLKVTRGAGHGFRAQRAGVLRGALTLRYATTTASGVRDVHVRAGTDYVGSSGGGAVAGQPRHHSVAILPTPIADDTEIWVDCFNGTGTTRQLEPNSGQWVRLVLELE